MKKYLFLLLVYNSGFAQDVSVCGFSSQDINLHLCVKEVGRNNILNQTDIKRITDEIGINDDFTYKNCSNIYNAVAMINPYNGKRFIGVDTHFFNTNSNKWLKYFILGHEIAHHLNGHTISHSKNYIEQQKRELDCDYFAGYILFTIGASEEDLRKYVIPNIPDSESNYSSHPSREKRIKALLTGYLNKMNEYIKLVDRLSILISEVYEKKHLLIQEKYKRKEELKKVREIRNLLILFGKDSNLRHIDNAKFILNSLSDVVKESEYGKGLRAYIDYSLGNYREALIYYRDQYYKTPKKENTLQYINILELSGNIDIKIDQILVKDVNDPEILNSLYLYFERHKKTIKAKEIITKAYELIKNEKNSLLKSDILISYGRMLFTESMRDKKRTSFWDIRLKFLEAKKILDEYPEEGQTHYYYYTMLYHIGATYAADRDCKNAEYYFNILRSRLKDKSKQNTNFKDKDYYFSKIYIVLAHCYLDSNQEEEAIYNLSNAIDNEQNLKNKIEYIYKRGLLYKILNKPHQSYKDFRIACDEGLIEACNELK